MTDTYSPTGVGILPGPGSLIFGRGRGHIYSLGHMLQLVLSYVLLLVCRIQGCH